MPKVNFPGGVNGGDSIVVESGGSIAIAAGGSITGTRIERVLTASECHAIRALRFRSDLPGKRGRKRERTAEGTA